MTLDELAKTAPSPPDIQLLRSDQDPNILKKPPKVKRKFSIAALICMFLFGMTWDVEFRMPYYEARGFISVEQTLIGVNAYYCWSGSGFANQFNIPEYGIGRTHRHDWATGGHFTYNPLATNISTKSTIEARKDFESEAVAAGHAKFVIKDKYTGKTEFEWNLWKECDR